MSHPKGMAILIFSWLLPNWNVRLGCWILQFFKRNQKLKKYINIWIFQFLNIGNVLSIFQKSPALRILPTLFFLPEMLFHSFSIWLTPSHLSYLSLKHYLYWKPLREKLYIYHRHLVFKKEGVNEREWRSQNRPTHSFYHHIHILNTYAVGCRSGMITLVFKDNTIPASLPFPVYSLALWDIIVSLDFPNLPAYHLEEQQNVPERRIRSGRT